MNIKSISLYNFRNFVQVDAIEFTDQAVLVAAAPNATGKTNFLESIVMLLRARSWRANTEQCVRWGEKYFGLKSVINTGGADTAVSVKYHVPSKKLRVEENSAPASLVTFYSHYPLVLFLPEDVFMFSRGPAMRRNYFNQVLVCVPAYVSALVQYQRALKQRNSLLKQAQAAVEVNAWTDLVVEYGQVLWRHRENLVNFIAIHLNEVYARISGEVREFEVILSTSVPNTRDFKQALEGAFKIDQRYGYTTHGPHRDDLLITTEGRNLNAVLSQGQMRSLVMSLKLVAHQFITSITNETPLLLLDEALSELDNHRQEVLLQNLPESQILLTCTSVPAVLRQKSDVHLLDLRSIIEAPKNTETVKTPVNVVVSQVPV